MAATVKLSAAGTFSAGSGSFSQSLTIPSGTNLLLVALNANVSVTPAFNGVAMTLVRDHTRLSTYHLYKLVNPSIGTYNLTISRSDTTYAAAVGILAIGDAVTSPFPDVVVDGSDYPFSGNITTLTTNITTVTDNDLLVAFAFEDNGHPVDTATSGWSLLAGGLTYPSANQGVFAKTTPATPVGTFSFEQHNTGSGNGHMFNFLIAIAPAAAAYSPIPDMRRAFL